ncbi:MAG: deoxyribonuclease I [Rubripirellula sp.]
MSDSDNGHPIQVAVVVLLLVGGGWYFFKHYQIDGLDGVSVYPKSGLSDDGTFVSYQDSPSVFTASTLPTGPLTTPVSAENPFAAAEGPADRDATAVRAPQTKSYRNVKIASWALDGFGPTKLANNLARQNVAKVIRQFDVIALQQIASIERDLVPRLVETINQGDRRYDFVMGPSTGPTNRQEQLAFVFDTSRLQVDRRETYTVEDPQNQVTFDPLVAWFRTIGPPQSQAWTFSLVNVRVDLARAPTEVAMLPKMLAAIHADGRGEDDVIMTGLFQADDAYLLPTMGKDSTSAAVKSYPTDIFGRYQTTNMLIEKATTSEFLGRGGVFNYMRHFNLTVAEAEAVTSHLPIYSEFTAWEGGRLQ